MDFLDSVLIIGSGGREHALVKALLRSNRALCLYGYPGSAGMENDGCMLIEEKISNWDDLATWALANEIDLTIVGPEQALIEGVVDTFNRRGLSIFGPNQKAARLEGSKYFAKTFMAENGIPTATFKSFTNKSDSERFLREHGLPIVIKVDGLAAGKGAIVCSTENEALEALARIFDNKEFGASGERVVIEEKLEGEEASVLVLCDGKDYRILPVAQDHKAVFDNDKGPNTGGMGAYAPAPVVTRDLLIRVENEIIKPTLNGMSKAGSPYRGVLYVGLMITDSGPKVIEYNCRFGDPETEAILPLVECDWYDVFAACAKGTLKNVPLSLNNGYCVTVVLASQGYPGSYERGKLISGIEKAEWSKANVDIYHAGTIRDTDGNFYTNGGRVLAVTVWADSLEEAISTAYENIAYIKYDGKIFRHDIGLKGLKRIKKGYSEKE